MKCWFEQKTALLKKQLEIALVLKKDQLKALFSCLEKQMIALPAVYTVAMIFTLVHSGKCV